MDVLIYNVGVWEKRGFEDDYTFDKDEVGDIANLININLLPQLHIFRRYYLM